MSTITNKQHAFEPSKLACISAVGLFFSDLVYFPIDTISTRMRANTQQQTSLRRQFMFAIKTQGIRSFYKGYSSTFFVSFIPQFIQIYIYENLCNKIKQSTFLERHKYLKWPIPFLLSGFAEFMSLLFYLPFDTVRTRLQVSASQYHYKNLSTGIKDVIQNEGLLRLYRGSYIYILNSIAYDGTLFQIYELIRHFLIISKMKKKQSGYQLTFVQSLFCTMLAAGISTLIMNPIDVIQTRFQLIDSRIDKLSTKKLIVDALKKEGIFAFYKGVQPKLLVNMGSCIIWFPLYDQFKGLIGCNHIFE